MFPCVLQVMHVDQLPCLWVAATLSAFCKLNEHCSYVAHDLGPRHRLNCEWLVTAGVQVRQDLVWGKTGADKDAMHIYPAPICSTLLVHGHRVKGADGEPVQPVYGEPAWIVQTGLRLIVRRGVTLEVKKPALQMVLTMFQGGLSRPTDACVLLEALRTIRTWLLEPPTPGAAPKMALTHTRCDGSDHGHHSPSPSLSPLPPPPNPSTPGCWSHLPQLWHKHLHKMAWSPVTITCASPPPNICPQTPPFPYPIRPWPLEPLAWCSTHDASGCHLHISLSRLPTMSLNANCFESACQSYLLFPDYIWATLSACLPSPFTGHHKRHAANQSGERQGP